MKSLNKICSVSGVLFSHVPSLVYKIDVEKELHLHPELMLYGIDSSLELIMQALKGKEKINLLAYHRLARFCFCHMLKERNDQPLGSINFKESVISLTTNVPSEKIYRNLVDTVALASHLFRFDVKMVETFGECCSTQLIEIYRDTQPLMLESGEVTRLDSGVLVYVLADMTDVQMYEAEICMTITNSYRRLKKDTFNLHKIFEIKSLINEITLDRLRQISYQTVQLMYLPNSEVDALILNFHKLLNQAMSWYEEESAVKVVKEIKQTTTNTINIEVKL